MLDVRPLISLDEGGLRRQTLQPVITGQPATQPNGNGWYRGDVTVQWSVTDPAPSSGDVAAPPATVVRGEGADLTATSDEACDAAGNCARGSVRGIRIDRTPPTVHVRGVVAGATYTLGAVPAASCTATDGLSGIAVPCSGRVRGGRTNGVGDLTYTATATDRAGNVTTVSVPFHVRYRFGGFQQPINDPALSPTLPPSVFRLNSTVPVRITLLNAAGRVVAPSEAPKWLPPQRGATTRAPVNEPTASLVSTSAFKLIGNVWQYNWNTKGLAPGYTYRLAVRLDDGSTHQVVVALR